MSTIFTKIINQEIPSYKIFEDDLTYSFLDIRPVNLGHTLVIPKKEVDYFLDLDDESYQAVFKSGKKISEAIQKATNCKRVGMAVEGFEVPHFHLHLVPLFGPTCFIDNTRIDNPSSEDMENIQKKILSYLT